MEMQRENVLEAFRNALDLPTEMKATIVSNDGFEALIRFPKGEGYFNQKDQIKLRKPRASKKRFLSRWPVGEILLVYCRDCDAYETHRFRWSSATQESLIEFRDGVVKDMHLMTSGQA